MKFHSDTGGDELRFTGYGDGFVRLGDHRLETSFAVSSTGIQTLDDLCALEDLSWANLAWLHDAPPEILLLGTGMNQRFPAPRLFNELAARRIGLEVMSNPAACRTFNILLSEGRKVTAIILLA